jgi:hypothetical protein
MKSACCLLLILFCSSTSALSAQTASFYAPARDTVFIESINPHLMYWVVGRDTLGTPIHSVTLERQAWKRSGQNLQVVVHQDRLLPESSTSTDTFSIEANGRLTAINGKAPGLHGRIDFLPRLPGEPLEVGVVWADTLSTVSSGPAGDHRYEVIRQYRVTHSTGEARSSIVEIEAEGEVRYRDGWWTDASESSALWIDVRGPIREVIVFDIAAGQIVERVWQMDLRGTGSLPDGAGGSRSVTAGLLSGSRERRVSQAEAATLKSNPQRALQVQ